VWRVGKTYNNKPSFESSRRSEYGKKNTDHVKIQFFTNAFCSFSLKNVEQSE